MATKPFFLLFMSLPGPDGLCEIWDDLVIPNDFLYIKYIEKIQFTPSV